MKRVVIIVFLFLVSFSFSYAQMMDMKKDGMMHNHQMDMSSGMMGINMGMNMDMMTDNVGMCLENADKIGLTDEQKSQLIPIHRDMMKKQARFKADLKIAEIDLMEIMEPKDFDLEKAIEATKKISEIRANQHIEMLKSMKKVRSILTEEQYKKMKSMMMGKKNMMKGDMKKMMPKKDKK